MKNPILNMILLSSFISSLSACSGSPENTASSESSTSSSSSSSGFPSDTYLYFTLGSQWESDAADAKFKDWGSCAVNSTSSNNIDCTVSIPEARLFFSKIKFNIGTENPTICPIITFAPYYYQRSSSATYLPPHKDATEVDCSGINGAAPTDKYCYGGAAPTLVTDFPTNTGNYFLASVSPSKSYTLDSGNKTRYYGTYPVNYLVTNDLSSNGRTLSGDPLIRTERMPNTFQDYQATCSNYWGEVLYSISITVKDENMDGSDGTTHDEYPDWQ